MRGRNFWSLLINGDDKFGEEQSAVKMQLFLEGETLEDIGVFSWVDVEGFMGCLHMLGSGWEWTVTPGWWKEHSAAAQWTVGLKNTAGLGSQARPMEGDRRLSPKPAVSRGIKRPASRHGMLGRNERVRRNSLQPG